MLIAAVSLQNHVKRTARITITNAMRSVLEISVGFDCLEFVLGVMECELRSPGIESRIYVDH